MIDFDVQKPIHLLNQVELEGLYNILTVWRSDMAGIASLAQNTV